MAASSRRAGALSLLSVLRHLSSGGSLGKASQCAYHPCRRHGAHIMSSTPQRTVRVGQIEIANDRPLAVIAGPCALESRAHALEVSAALKEIAAKLGLGLIYKTSFDKANRTSAN